MSDEQIHTTQTNNVQPPKEPDNWFVDNLKKQFIGIAVGAAIAVYTFVGGSHESERDLNYRISTLEKTVEKLAVADKEQTDTLNNLLIALTKVSESQNRLASDVRDIQEQQRKNTEMIFNRK